MVVVNFTPNLRRHLDCPPQKVEGASVAEAIAEACRRVPKLEGYILDEQGDLRKHVTLFLNGVELKGAQAMQTPLSTGAELYVMQALSGG